MAAITKKTAAGFERMLSEVGVLSVEQLAKLSAAVAVCLQAKLQAKLESGPIPAKKVAAKKVAAAASAEEDGEEAEAAAPKAQSPHLQYNQKWSRYVGAYANAHGWEVTFLKKVTNRSTKESHMQEMPPSMRTADGHVFSNTGKPITPAEVLSLAKHLKDTDDDIWIAYMEQNPLPVTAPKAKKVIPVKAAAAAVTVVPPAVVLRKLPVVATAAAAAAPVPPPRVIANSKGKKAVEPEWVCPDCGEGEWVMDGQTYIRDVDDLVWTLKVNADGDAERNEWCGKWDKVTKRFDKSIVDPRLEEE